MEDQREEESPECKVTNHPEVADDGEEKDKDGPDFGINAHR
jgi:hypothetical protein